ncbi:hypothetical protein SAMN05661091_0863 [Paenibacillus uliginis N3/975]|uniref:Uncharacterized protein n=1 Tax=Paenibacillus uliginis N3/975 TaxID=1313296 RepID=A0A1X7GNN5_9BACL|nr:hypothetical protein [Paenibacillus uliginis]SMF72380.1 hypothetical protein SAMN05661091_0863 [Paenibacillus uliginis N3/975]
MLKDFQVRVVANAYITRVNEGEGIIDQVVSTYPMQADDLDKVLAYVYVIRPDLVPTK